MTARKQRYRRMEQTIKPWDARRRFRCRCSKCEHRETFRGYPWLKKRIPPCPECGAKQWRIDWYRQLTETTRNRCDCGGLHFPHRRGSCVPKEYRCAA